MCVLFDGVAIACTFGMRVEPPTSMTSCTVRLSTALLPSSPSRSPSSMQTDQVLLLVVRPAAVLVSSSSFAPLQSWSPAEPKPQPP